MPIQLVVRPAPGGQHDLQSIVTAQADQCLGTELFSDIRIDCPDGSISCHQSLLAPLSPLLSSVMGSYLPFPGLIHTVVMPIMTETMKSILKIIYTGKITLSSQEHVDKVLSGLKLLGIHLPGLECFRAAGYDSATVKPGQNSVSRVGTTNVPLPFSDPMRNISNICTNMAQLPSIPVMEEVKPILIPSVSSEDQSSSLDNLRVVLARQLLPLGIGESAECNVEGCSVLVTLSTLAQHFKDHKEKELDAFKCNECNRGFKHKKNLEIHRIRDHAQQIGTEKQFVYSEETVICENNNVKTNYDVGFSSVLTRNKKRMTNVHEGMAAAQLAPTSKVPLVCALCQASLQTEWYRPPSRHNCPHSTPKSSNSQVHCNQCSTPLSSTWYLPPSRHGCTAVSTTTRGQVGSSTSARKKPRLSAIISRDGNIEEVEHSCGKCFIKFSTLVDLRSHYTVSHYWDIIASKFTRWGRRCFICMRAFQSPDHLVRHMGNFHSFVDQCLLKDGLSFSIVEKSIKLQTLECGFCGEVKSTSGELKSHLCYVHFSKELEREFPANNSEKTCGLCGKVFNSNQARTKHIGYFHDHVLKYAKKFINVAVNDAQLIAENGFDEETDEACEPFVIEDSDQYLVDWDHPSPFVSRTSSPQVSDKSISKDETSSKNVLPSRAKVLFPSEQPQPLQKCPLTSCFRQCTNKVDMLVHLAMTHYLDELHKEYSADFDESRCKLCKKSLLASKEGFLKHLAVDHEVVMSYVERDMALEAELNKAVDDLEVTV